LDIFHPTEITAAIVASKLREDISSSNSDHFTFVVPEIGEADLAIPEVKAFRYTVETRLDGRRFENNRIDIGLGDPLIPPFDTLASSDLLSFANFTSHISGHLASTAFGRKNPCPHAII
jgi:hypothetical protein